jgi:O-antigen/teichoic acid export membrane protein
LKGLFKRAIFLSLIKFGLPIIPNSLAYLVVEISDKYLMRVLLDKEQLGIYSANYKFGSIILFLIIAFRTAWQPFFLKISETKDAKKVYAKVLTYYSLAGVLLVIFVTFFIEYLVAMPLLGNFTLLGESYWSGIQIIPIILTSYLFYGFYVNFTVGVFITKKTKLMVIFTGLAAIINISSNFYLMPAFGIMGAAIATLLSYFVMALSIFVANQKIYKINYEFKRIISLLILLFSVLFIYYYFNPDIWIRIAILIVIPFLLFTMGFFKSAEIRASKELFKL